MTSAPVILEQEFGHGRELLVRMHPSPAGCRDGRSRPSKRLFHCRLKVTSRSVSAVSTTKMASRLGRLGGARVLADGMIRVGRLRPALARAEHLRLAVIHLASDRAREDVAGDEGGARVVMRPRCAAGWIFDDKADKALAGNVRYRLLEGRRDRLTILRSRLG